jgi:hypothetical protein
MADVVTASAFRKDDPFGAAGIVAERSLNVIPVSSTLDRTYSPGRRAGFEHTACQSARFFLLVRRD